MPRRVPLAVPFVGPEEMDAIRRVLESGWWTTAGETHAFETEFGAFVKAPVSVAVSSCTAALHTALAAANIGPGDEVITTTWTFTATVNVIEHVGARPVLCDVEPDTLNIAPDALARAVTKRTKAIMPVHFAGHPCDMNSIMDIARTARAVVIEDAAHALPASYHNRPIGTIGHMTCFSFYATKNLATGEGGMLTATDPALEDDIRMLVLHGMSRDAWNRYHEGGNWYYEVVRPGFKYNFPDILAAIGRVQLTRLPHLQHRRAEIVQRYNVAFSTLKGLEPPTVRPDVESAHHLYPLRLHLDQLSCNRDVFISELSELGIGASVHFIPIHLHPYYRSRYGFAPGDFPVALAEYQRVISLPLYPSMKDEDVDYVVDAVERVVQRHRR